MALQCGIVGLPNVGKSTIFNALTAAEIPAENYPFCTVDPNTGVVPVPDPRLARLAEVSKSKRVVPTALELVDIAGLVRGASRGEGLGNQFLANIRETDAIVQVIRCFDDPNVVHVDGAPDPLRDVETIETELCLADLESLERRVERARKAAKTASDEARSAFAFLEALHRHVGDGRLAREFPVPDAQRLTYRDCYLLTAKPMLYVANVDEATVAGGDERTAQLEAHAERVGAGLVRLCGKLEAEIVTLPPEERAEFLHHMGLEEPGLHRLVRAAYSLLGLITFLTTGPNESRAWTVRRGTTAQQAAGAIHTDFARHFVRAEVTPFDDYVAAGGEVGARAQGKTRIEGRDYVVRDGDVMLIRANP